jgi:RimJ/RimL family protein N-acetyltransferase
VAADHELSTVVADTTVDNIASQRTLIRAGFRHVGTDDEFHHYEASLDAAHRPV